LGFLRPYGGKMCLFLTKARKFAQKQRQQIAIYDKKLFSVGSVFGNY